jgi:putative tricarboxylic transport membrane protein
MILASGLIKWGWDLEIGTLAAPESGFIILWAGLFMLGLSCVICVQTFFKKTEANKEKLLWSGPGWKKTILVFGSLVAYTALLTPLGFLISSFLLLLFFFSWIEPHKWTTSIWVSLLIVSSAYLVFGQWLGSQLPKGFIEFPLR